MVLRLLCLFALTTLCRAAHSSEKGHKPNASPQRHALLVGCTVYPNAPNVRELWGPANDVPLWAQLLEKSSFPRKNITRLVGWPADAKQRPTRDNIAAAFENLIAKADADSQIFILIGGHGTQLPIPAEQVDPLDPKNPEPDGLDEVFMPADVKAVGGRLRNAIRDDQFGKWLDRFRQKGAAVWIVFDCCHSGTMDRGTNEVERAREVRPQQLGISDAALRHAQQRARKAVEARRKAGRAQSGIPAVETGSIALDLARKGQGSVVAFYGAQAFETAPELPRPRGVPITKENYYGLLSYTLVKILRQSEGGMSYRQLSRILAAAYAADRGARAPSPFCEGDLDREVFGLRVWPKGGDIVLQHRDGKLQLNSGELRGLTPGTILSVHPAAVPRESKNETILGYLKVVSTRPASAEVVPYTDPAGKTPAVAAGKLPGLSRCKILVRDFGDLKLSLAIQTAAATDASTARQVQTALKKMPKAVQDMVRIVADEAAADFVLWIESGRVFLKLGTGHQTNAKLASAEVQRSRERDLPRRRYGAYPAGDVDRLSGHLARDLQKVFAARNLWRISGTLGNKIGADNDYGLKIEFQKLKPNREPDGELVNGHPVVSGQRVRHRLKNDGPYHLWVTRIFLDGDFGIVVRSLSLKRGSETKWFTGKISGNSFGREGMIVFAVSMEAQREQPDYDFLEQKPLKDNSSFSNLNERMRSLQTRSSMTPFRRLMKAATFGQGSRGFEEDEPTQPAILTWSWILIPKPE